MGLQTVRHEWVTFTLQLEGSFSQLETQLLTVYLEAQSGKFKKKPNMLFRRAARRGRKLQWKLPGLWREILVEMTETVFLRLSSSRNCSILLLSGVQLTQTNKQKQPTTEKHSAVPLKSHLFVLVGSKFSPYFLFFKVAFYCRKFQTYTKVERII